MRAPTTTEWIALFVELNAAYVAQEITRLHTEQIALFFYAQEMDINVPHK